MLVERRRNPRYPVHLTALISLIEQGAWHEAPQYSAASRGHCDAISKSGFGLSLVGTRVPENELTRIGRLLLVRIDLPAATIEAVTCLVNYRRTGPKTKQKWLLGVKIQRMSDVDEKELKKYLEQKRQSAPLILV